VSSTETFPELPLFDLRLEPQDLEAVAETLRSGWLTLGPRTAEFEEAFATQLGARHAIALSSCTAALHLAYLAAGAGPGDEVIVPSFTFYASAEAIPPTGARPVFCDIDPDTYCMTAETVRAVLTPRTRAVIAVHLFGNVVPIAEIEELGVPVLEDAAQAAGSTSANGRPGALGTAATFSFFPSKNLGAFGDAGMVVCQEESMAAKIRALRNHGMEDRYYHSMVGGNFRLDALQAALLAVKLPHFDGYTAARRRNAALYTDRLAKLPGVSIARPAACGCAQEVDAEESARLVLPVAYPHNGHIWNQYTLRVIGAGRRDALRAHLTARGIGSEIYYPVPLHEQKCFSYLGHQPGDFPWAHRLAGEVISVPIYPELPAAQIEQVCTAIWDFLK